MSNSYFLAIFTAERDERALPCTSHSHNSNEGIIWAACKLVDAQGPREVPYLGRSPDLKSNICGLVENFLDCLLPNIVGKGTLRDDRKTEGGFLERGKLQG